MNIFLKLMAVLIVVKLAALSYLNFGVSVDVIDPLFRKTFRMSEAVILFGAFLGGIIFTLCLSYSTFSAISNKLKKESRNAEKNLVSAEASQDKIKMLEAKVETLEAALKEALKK